MPKYPPDPEIRYFRSLPGAPRRKGPTTFRSYLIWRGLIKGRKKLAGTSDRSWWAEWFANVPRAEGWTPRVPDTWPEPLLGCLPAHVTPTAWIDNMIPSDRNGRGIRARYPVGTGELSAAALGWALQDHEVRRARAAAADLMEDVAWLIWAYDLDLSYLPFPTDSATPLERRLKARADLKTKPLSVGSHTVTWALPALARRPDALVALCPRLSKTVGKSKKMPVAKYLNANASGGGK